MPTVEEAAIAAELKKKGLDVEEGKEEEGEAEVIEVDEAEADDEVEVGEEEGSADDGQTEEELNASSSGWKPKDEWEGDPAEWVTAKQFLRNGEYLRKIHNQNRKIKELDGVVSTLAKQQKKIFDAGYDKAKKELKSALREANKEGDDATAELVEQRLEELETRRKEDTTVLETASAPAKEEPKVAPEFAGWVARNDWFTKYPEMRAYAESIGVQYASKNLDASNAEVYQHVTEQVKKTFPSRFGATMKKVEGRKKAGSQVESGDDLAGTRRNTAITKVALSPEEKTVGRALVARGLYTNLNEYAVDLKKYGVKG